MKTPASCDLIAVVTPASALASANYRNDDFDFACTRNSVNNDQISYSNERACQMVRDTEYREEVVAYRVLYHYNGRDFVTDYDPGPRLRARVNATPDD